ncbi:tyrosine-type recombinase/integrase [Streptomyces sp. NPDC058914]|uniref:tyrosine-type recombinase/integrase n=1 Tax=Streptomyces TaxID=1883 RepID=UPI003683F53A
MPHQLTLGATLSGKSMYLRHLVSGLARQPVALVGIDCKRGVELAPFAPRLSALATDPDEAAELLSVLVKEMEDRYDLIKARQGIAPTIPDEEITSDVWGLPEKERPVPSSCSSTRWPSSSSPREMAGLRWSDLDLDSRVLYVRQQTQRRRGVLYDDDPKSRRRRAVPIPALCIAPLRWHRMRQAAARAKAGEKWQGSDYVFTTRTGRPVEPRNIYRSFTRVAQSAGLRVVRLHDARHGTATLLTAAGVALRVVMEILGHSQIGITMDVYTHVVQDTQREARSHMDRLLRRRHGRQ